MNTSIFGRGYVGLVSGARLYEVGQNMVCMDVDTAKIEKLKIGILLNWGSGHESLVGRGVMKKRLHFPTDATHAVQHQYGNSLRWEPPRMKMARPTAMCAESYRKHRAPNFTEIATRMRNKVIVDGRNLYRPHKLGAEGGSTFLWGA